MPLQLGFFDTAIGPCGVAWQGHGLLAVQLPEAQSLAATQARLQRRVASSNAVHPLPSAQWPGFIQSVVGRIVALLKGQAVAFDDVELDEHGTPAFHRQVYALTRAIAHGNTLTYGELARRLGVPHAAREVGQALGQNPHPLIVPCHRVLAADGQIGGFSAADGPTTKQRLLTIENARLGDGPDLFATVARP